MTKIPNWVTLTSDEQEVWFSRPSMLPYIPGMVFGAGIALASVALWLAATGVLPTGPEIPETVPATPLALAGVGLGLGIILLTYLQWRSTQFLLTTEEVYRKEGIISRDVVNTNLRNVYNTQFTQPPLGFLLSIGTVNIQTAGTGGTDLTYSNVRNPDKVVEMIVRLRDEKDTPTDSSGHNELAENTPSSIER